ncbi:Tn3 family transposase [Bacillus thuringiensis]|uniref:Tn3 family transposase n=1 Tax=Bacillus thuringiensis TaxID=1428 RepID=UPI0039909C42
MKRRKKFTRVNKHIQYKHIDPLFSDVIDWKLIETRWRDLFHKLICLWRLERCLYSPLL